jgi:hypothetical protein
VAVNLAKTQMETEGIYTGEGLIEINGGKNSRTDLPYKHS